MNFGQRVKKRREELRLTPKQISSLINVPLSSYTEWENGRQIRGEEVYPKLARVLKLSLNELITGISTQEALKQELLKLEECVKNIRQLL